MPEETVSYRRNLPHIQPAHALYFITFRLANTIPRSVLLELVEQRKNEEHLIQQQFKGAKLQDALYRLQKRHFGHYDAWLDRCSHGERWLADEKVAAIVAEEIHRGDGENYRLLSYCIMPNHVHLLIDTADLLKSSSSNRRGATSMYPLADMLRLLKGRTARYCNLALERSGVFWQSESYDHIVRDDQELERIVHYIIWNPVKAGLIRDWHEWKFAFISPDLGEW